MGTRMYVAVLNRRPNVSRSRSNSMLANSVAPPGWLVSSDSLLVSSARVHAAHLSPVSGASWRASSAATIASRALKDRCGSKVASRERTMSSQSLFFATAYSTGSSPRWAVSMRSRQSPCKRSMRCSSPQRSTLVLLPNPAPCALPAPWARSIAAAMSSPPMWTTWPRSGSRPPWNSSTTKNAGSELVYSFTHVDKSMSKLHSESVDLTWMSTLCGKEPDVARVRSAGRPLSPKAIARSNAEEIALRSKACLPPPGHRVRRPWRRHPSAHGVFGFVG